MKKLVKLLGFVVVFALVGTAAWRIELSAPNYYQADGHTLWQRRMSLAHKASVWPYVTTYNAHWNGVSVSMNGEALLQNSFVDFVLWNGHGVSDVQVWELSKEGKVLAFPNPIDARSMNQDGFRVSFGNVGNDRRYFTFGIPIPASDVEKLWISVTDDLGNVTTDTLKVSDIAGKRPTLESTKEEPDKSAA